MVLAKRVMRLLAENHPQAATRPDAGRFLEWWSNSDEPEFDSGRICSKVSEDRLTWEWDSPPDSIKIAGFPRERFMVSRTTNFTISGDSTQSNR